MSFIVALDPLCLVMFPDMSLTVPVATFIASIAPPIVSPFLICFTACSACLILSLIGLFIPADIVNPLLLLEVCTSLVSILAPYFTSPLLSWIFPYSKFVAVISAPLFKTEPSPTCKLDFAFTVLFSSYVFCDFPYPTEALPWLIPPVKPFFLFSS